MTDLSLITRLYTYFKKKSSVSVYRRSGWVYWSGEGREGGSAVTLLHYYGSRFFKGRVLVSWFKNEISPPIMRISFFKIPCSEVSAFCNYHKNMD